MRTTFSKEEVALLKQNPNVFSCTDKSVNYTYEFKKHALELHNSVCREFRRAGNLEK